VTALQRQYRQSAAVLFRRVGPEVLAAVPGNGEVIRLDGPAPTAWTLMAYPITASELTNELAAMYSRSADEIRHEVEYMIDDLVRRGLIDELHPPR
jgi:hypothetical protein